MALYFFYILAIFIGFKEPTVHSKIYLFFIMYITSFKSLATVILGGFLYDKYVEVEIPPQNTSIELNSDHHINNWIREIRVPKNLCFIGYDKPFLSGKPYFFPYGYHHLARHPLYEKISSFHVVKSSTCNESVLNFIYPERYFGGTPISFPTYFNFHNYKTALARYNLRHRHSPTEMYSLKQEFGDTIHSLKPAQGACLVIYNNIRMTYDRTTYTRSTPNTKKIFWLAPHIYPLVSVSNDQCRTYFNS